MMTDSTICRVLAAHQLLFEWRIYRCVARLRRSKA